MKSFLVAIVVGILLFGASAAVSWFLIFKQMEPAVAATDPKDSRVEALQPFSASIDEADKVEAMPVALRPDVPVTVEAVTELAQSIMEKERSLIESEKRLKKEEKRIGLLFEDVRRERDELSAFGQRIDAKVIEAREAVEMLKVQNQTLADQTEALSSLEKTTGKKMADAETDEVDRRVKAVKNWFNKLDSEQASDYLKEFANRGDIDFAAKLLDSLDDRQIAKILAALDDAPLVAQIVDAYTRNKSSNKSAKADKNDRLVR